MYYEKYIVYLHHNLINMTKEQRIQELVEYAKQYLYSIIPYDTPNYDEVLVKEAEYWAEAMYYAETNPESKCENEPLLPIKLQF